jgi:hypothetical protein
MDNKCSFCGSSFLRSDRALLSEKYCPNCITERIKQSGATFFNKDNVSFKYNESGYITISPNN